MNKLFITFALLGVIACSHKIMLSQSDADRAAAKFPGTTLADLQQGKTLYESTCNKCHGLKNPRSRDEAGWRQIVPVMAQKAKVDAHTEDLILRYLVTASAK